MNQIYQNLNKLKKIKFCQDLNKYIEKEFFTKNILLNIYYKEIYSNTIKSSINKFKNQYYMNNKNNKKMERKYIISLLKKQNH